MNSQRNLWVAMIAVGFIAIAALLFATKSISDSGTPDNSRVAGSTVNGGNVTDYTAVNTTAGYWVGGVKIAGSSGILAASLAQFDAGVLMSYTNSTSTTATTQTLVAADIANYSTVIMTPNTAAATFTLPASSTLSAFIPTAGDWSQQCWYNATSTTAAKITFAAGTGIDLEVASSTAGGGTVNLTIEPGNTGCFRFIRKPATATAFDIVAQFTSFVDGD